MIKRLTTYLIATLLFTMGICSHLDAQISSYSVTTPLDKCQPATSAQLTIGSTTAKNLLITMPVGIIYTASSATCNGNAVAAPSQVTNGNGSITYTFTIDSCSGQFVYSHTAICAVDETATLFDIAQLKNGSVAVGAPFQSLSYNVGEATPQVSSSSNSPASVNILSTSTRTVNITNGGLGTTSDFYFEDIVPHNSLTFNLANVKMNGVLIPSGNISFLAGATYDTFRVRFTSTEFALLGNLDNNFDGVRTPGPAQESFALTYDQTTLTCGAGNAIESDLRTYYGCGSICSDVSIIASLGVNLSAPPILNTTFTLTATSCYNYTTIDTGKLVITNTGGIARNVSMYFGDYWGRPAASNLGLGATELDTASVMVSINGGAPFHPVLSNVKYNRIAPYNYNNTASCGTELKPCGAFINFNSITAGQTVIVTYLFKKCKISITACPAGNFKSTDTRINFSVYNLSYKNACLDATYGDAPSDFHYPSMVSPTQTLSYEYVWLTLNPEFPTDMVDNQVATFTTNFTDGSYDYLFRNNGYVQMTQSLPPGFTLSTLPDSVQYIDGGGRVWKGNVTSISPLIVQFPLPRPSNFDISSSKLNLKIQFNCAAYAAGPGSTPTVHQSWGVMTDPSCSSLMELLCFDHTINLHCPSPCPEGIGNVLFNMNRISVGAPDNDNDGIADASGSINPALVRLDRAMVGDTIELSYHGIVYDNGTPFTQAFAHTKFPSISQWDVLPNSEAYLYRGGSLVSSLTNLTTQVNTNDSLKTTISGLGSMTNLDSIVVKVRLRLNYNTGGPLEPVVPDNILYATRPAAPSTWLYCDHWNGRITKVGWYHTQYWGQSPTLTNCNANYIDITDYLSIGNCCNNYGNRSNIFPYEVKKYSYLDSVNFIIPNGLVLDHVDALFVRPGGANTANFSSSTYTVSNVPTTFSGGFYRMGYKNYYADFGGNAANPIADDGWHVITRVYVKATCTTPTLTNMYLLATEKIKSINPAVTDATYLYNSTASVHTNRFATFNGSQLTAVAGANASINIAGDSIKWNNLILANQSTIGSNSNTWIYIQQPTSSTTIISVTDNLGAAVPQVNGFYQFGNMATSQQKTFNIIAKTTSCNKDSVKVYYGYDCTGYPTTFSPTLCSYSPIVLVARPLSAKIDGGVTPLAITPANPASPSSGNYGSSNIDMCTPFPVELVLNSALQGNIYDVNAQVKLPSGVSYVPGSAYIEYPIGTTPRVIDAGQEAVLASIGAGGILNFKLDSIDASNFNSVLDKGLFGTAKSPSTLRQVKIRFKCAVDCDYQGNDRLKMTMLAKRACGINATNNGSVKTSSRLNLSAPPSVYTNTVSNTVPSLNSCSDVQIATTTITKNGTNPIGSEDSIRIEIPTGFALSSITCSGCPSSTVTPVITSDGVSDVYKWPYPAFSAPNYGDASPFTYSYSLSALSTVSCGANLELSASVIEKAGFTCNSVLCSNTLPVEGGSATSTFNYNKPTFTISPLSVITYSTALPYTYYINSTVNNTSGVSANGFKLVYAYDVDNDSLYTAGTDILIDAKSYSNTIAAGNNVVINESYTSAIDPGTANFMVAIVPLSSNPTIGACSCNETYSLVPISYQLPASLGDLVWNDVNHNGIKDGAETGVQNITVKLYNSAGDSIGVTTTNASGNYLFSNLIPGTYSVGFSDLPQYYIFSNANVGSNDNVDSDPNKTTGKTGTYTLVAGQNDLSVDAGIYFVPLPVATAGADKNLTCTITSATLGAATIADLTYSWTPATGLSATNIAQPIASPTVTTTYYLTTTNALGLTAFDTVTVNVNTTTPTADAGPNKNLNCSTTSTSIGTTAIVGNNYSWSPSTALNSTISATPNASPSVTTVYTVTVTGVNGCIATSSMTVNVNITAPIADAGTDKILDCTTTSTSIGTAAISGNVYTWVPSLGLNDSTLAQPTANPSISTTYSLTVTGSNGCMAYDNVTVLVNTTPPVANAGSTLNLNCTTTSGLIGTASVSGNIYVWSPSIGLNDSSLAQPTANPTTNTTYNLLVTGANGCTSTSSVSVNVNTTIPSADAGVDKNLDCTTTNTTIGTAGLIGNSYSWSPTTGLNSSNVAQPIANPTATTIYTVTATNTNGCSSTSTVTVNVNTTLPIADAGASLNLNCSITNDTIGTAAISGNTYSWLPTTGLNVANIAQPIANPTATTTYFVTVTGSNGCTETSSVIVNVNTTLPIADAGATQNLDCNTTTATIGTTSIVGNTFSWSPTTGLNDASIAEPIASPTATTTYTVTVTGSNGCIATSTVDVNVNTTLPAVDAGVNKNVNCTITSAIIGTSGLVGNSYSWSPSADLNIATIPQPSASPSSTTTYTLTVTGSNGCTNIDSVTVNVNTTIPLADAGSTQNLDCTTTSATIGTSSVLGNSYSWSPSIGLSATNIAQPTANPTTSTTYTVTVTGANGCQATSTVMVVVNTVAPIPTISGNTIVCNGSMNLLTAIGGVSYVWSNTSTTDTTTVGVGTYDVTATSANGCTASTSITLTNVQGSIGNYVWEDLNHNGLNDEPTTAGINGVAVELWKETPSGSNVFVLDQSTTTVTNMGNAGYYNFVICESANYQVKFPVNVGTKKLTIYTSTDSTDNNSDANSTTGISYTIAIDVNASGNLKDNMTIDAAYYSLAQLGNYVWNDKNKDGIQDANEVGVAGITVTLYNGANVVIGTTITDAYGYYKFTALEPGDYMVGCTSPANYVFSPQNATTDLIDNDVNPATGLTGVYTLISGDSNMSVDAGIFYKEPTTATVGNYVWFDTNNDGIQDATEQGISSVTVSLYDNSGKIVATVITNANGYYTFTNVLPGTYSVGFTAPVGLVFSPNAGGVNDATNSDANPTTGQTASFVVNAGDQITYVDAGLYSQPILYGAIGDKVWNDANRDGVQDANEIGVQGITVTLYQADGTTVIATTSTDAFGNYIFNNLPQGEYVVGFSNVPSAYTLTTNSGVDSTTNSDADLISGKTAIINLAQGQYNMSIDAGIHHTSLTNNNSIGDLVWNDLNNNGIQEVGESGVAGVTVTLYDNAGTVIATTSTNENGQYLFPDLPNGTFYVGFSNLPVGFIFTAQGAGTSATDNDANQTTGLTASVTLTGGTNITDLDAGIYAGIKTGIATLGDLVWYDLNNNGLQDANESGVAGILVTLYQADGTTVVSTTTTDALGNYIFTDLASASYVVGFANLPSGYTISAKNIDAEGLLGDLNSDVDINTLKSDVVIVGIGDNIMSVDMGIVPPTGSASLGNLVWFDLNNDGLQTVGEPGVQGVSVTLYNSIGTAIATTTTNANGEYNFVGLTPSTYSVGFGNLPTGYAFATQDVDANGVNGTSNSDANTSTGLTNAVTLFAGDNNTNLDAGIVSTTVASVGDYVWFDANHDGIQDANEEGMGGILVTLYDNNNVAVASAITQPNGSYIFTNVTPGDYTIGFSNLPSSLIFTTQETNLISNTGSNVNPTTGLTNSFTVVAGTHNPTIDAGLTTTIFAELGNYVWHDVDEDGLQGATEVGVPGVVVKLYAQDGITVLATAITDGNGAYNFTNLNGGSYVVGFSNFPIGATRTKSVGSVNDVTNSDIDVTGKTAVIVLTSGSKNPNIDAGIYFGVPLGSEVLRATTAILTSTTSCNVNWFTKNEINTKSFTIERSTDGAKFENVGSKEASITTVGTTNYSFIDDISAVINAKVIYYRIVLNDIDNKKMTSNIISVINKSDIEIVIRPVPFINEILIDYPSVDVSELQIEITDLSGRAIRKSIQEIVKGMNTIKVNDLSNLPSGAYFIKVIDENAGVKFMQKISK